MFLAIARPRSRALHGFAVLTALGTYLLTVAGGLGAPAGLHRFAAGFVGLLIFSLAVLLGRESKLSRLGWLACWLVLAQGGLGALGAVVGLPAVVSALHTGLSLTVFMTVFYLAAQTAHGASLRPELAPTARRLALASAIAVVAQALLGVLARQPGVAGALDGAHRMGALAVAVLVFASSFKTFDAAEGRPWLRALALAAPVLVATQILLGVRSMQTLLDRSAVQAHLATGAALLGATWAVFLLSAPQRTAPRVSVRALVELAKPRLSALVVFTFGAGLAFAPGTVAPWRAALSLLGTVLIVAAANALNMYLERDIDGLMQRTARRPLVEGRLSPEAAIGFGAALACLAFPLLLVAGNQLTALLGLVAFVSYVWVYTPMKRRSAAALFVGAVPGAIPPVMGWTVATGRLDAGALALFAILFCWQVPHFLAIAFFRLEEYGRAGIRVLPAVSGAGVARVQIVLFTVALLGASLALGALGVGGTGYVVAATLLGLGFLGCGVAGFRATDERAWAKSLFFASLLYLPALFAALALG